jgi:hypothetical protein
MASIVLIEATGTVKTLKAKELTLDTLYKKCGFRVNDDFLCRHTWNVKLEKEGDLCISVWAKKTGKANFENKYDFPPPIDNDLFFGTCAVVRTAPDGTFLDLTKETWLKIYEKLFGGFEDIGDEDEYSEDELANVDPSLLTSNGYLKDGFVVSDKEAISGTPSGETSEEEVVTKKTKVKKVDKKVMATKPMATKPMATKPMATKPMATKPMATVTKATTTVKKATVKKATVKKATATKATATKSNVKASGKTKSKVNETEPATITEESDGTTSELEEEVYTFSDDE